MTFLFDIGRVLLDFDFESSLSRLLPPEISDSATRLARLLDRKDEFEAGAIDADLYIAWALDVLGSKVGPAEFRTAWRQIFTPNEPMWGCVRKLAADGHRLILFSNTNAIHCPWIFETYPEFSLFEASVLSFEARSIKPELPIYRHAIEVHELDPASTRYIDDLPLNIATGNSIGFRSWQYDMKNHSAFEAWLADELALS
jgi:FMN phosphatase YigB (HAD superfamily)